MQVLTFVVQKILDIAAGEVALLFFNSFFYALLFDCYRYFSLYLYSYNPNTKDTRVIQLHTNISLIDTGDIKLGIRNLLSTCTVLLVLYFGVHRWRIWLRHCATSQKVASSIPDGVIGIFH